MHITDISVGIHKMDKYMKELNVSAYLFKG